LKTFVKYEEYFQEYWNFGEYLKKLKNMTIVKVRNDKIFEEYEDFEEHQDFWEFLKIIKFFAG
jgi:hypothetical protein